MSETASHIGAHVASSTLVALPTNGWTGLGLRATHQAKLEASAVAPAVAQLRAYKSVERRSDLKRLGFADAQCNVPALLIPIYAPTGERAGYVIRPDTPRIVDGRAVKYETPARTSPVLDVAPATLGPALDPTVPLWITEGPIKGDALASVGLPAIALAGVWGWRGRGALGGQTALPDWENVPLRDREVVVCFDSDVATNPHVAAAARRLGGLLERRGARVRFCILPEAEDGTKTGVDDYLAQGHSLDELRALIVDVLPEVSRPEGSGEDKAASERRSEVINGAVYLATTQGMAVERVGADGLPTRTMLTNCSVEIVAERLIDNGHDEVERKFEVEVRIGGAVGRGVVDPSQLPEIRRWLPRIGGANASVTTSRPEQAVAAVQLTSQPEVRHVYAHIGWSKVGGEWRYLHRGGGLGPDGNDRSLTVEAGPSLSPIELPDPPDAASLSQACATVAALLEAGPERVTVPLLGAVFRAVLGTETPDWSLLVVGRTGAGKTTLACLAQSFLGSFTTPPGNWSATANALEELTFAAKDAPLVVDEFAPSATSARASGVLQEKAERVIRAQGNLSARLRMRADASLRPPRPPRGLVISTGELLPQGTSLIARTLVVELEPGAVDFAGRVTQVQRARADLARWMAGFLSWLARDLEARHRRWHELREAVDLGDVKTGHPRTPQIARDLIASWGLAFEWLHEAEAVIPEWNPTRVRQAVLEAIKAQAGAIASTSPGLQFLHTLAEVLHQGGRFLNTLDGNPPANAERWGWVADGFGGFVPPKPATQLGWLVKDERGDEVWLLMGPAMAEVVSLLARAGRALVADESTVLRDLESRAVLVRPPGDPHLLVRRRINGERVRVAVLRVDALDAVDDAAS